MAGPIKIAILADAKSATAGVKTFAADVDSSVGNAADSLGRASRDTQRHSRDIHRRHRTDPNAGRHDVAFQQWWPARSCEGDLGFTNELGHRAGSAA